jgi:hypothetical protein
VTGLLGQLPLVCAKDSEPTKLPRINRLRQRNFFENDEYRMVVSLSDMCCISERKSIAARGAALNATPRNIEGLSFDQDTRVASLQTKSRSLRGIQLGEL